MTFPQELTDALTAINYTHVSKLPYDTKLQVLKKGSENILALRDWAESHEEPIEGWVELFFSYFERMTADIEVGRDIWTSYYELERALGGFIIVMMRRQEQTAETITHFGKSLNDWLLRTEHGALVFGYVSNMILDYSKPLKIRYKLDGAAAEALYPVYAMWIDTAFELAAKAKSRNQVHRLKMAIYYLETEMKNIGYEDKDPKQLEPLNDRILLFQLSVFDTGAFINQEENIKKIYAQRSLGDIALPEADKLLEEGRALFASDKQRAVLYLLLHNLIRSLDIAAGKSDEIREYHSSGANIGNVDGVSTFSAFLELLTIYVNEADLIACYLAQYITSDDALFVVASVAGHDSYGASPERENVKHQIVLALVEPDSETERQIALKRLCVRWGLLDKEALPAKYQFKSPKKLPSDAYELAIFYKALKIGKAFKLNKKAKEENIPASFPEDIRQIYLLFNGAPDDRHFAKLSGLEEIRQDIMDTYRSQLEEDYDEDPDTDDSSVDIRKHIHPGIIPIGQNYSGDSYFADPKCLSVTGHPVIIGYAHDEYLTGKLVANSLAEFLARHIIDRFTEVNGREKDLLALLDTPIQIQP